MIIPSQRGGDRAVRGVVVGAFGDKFRKERERRGFTLDDVSGVTKIGSRMLKAIEEEHFDRLPGGIFTKGFIRAYARHLGLNDDEAVAEYLAALQEAQISAQNKASLNQPPQTESNVAQAGRRKIKALEDAEAEVEELPGLHLPKAEHIRTRAPRATGEPRVSWLVLASAVAVVLVGILLWNRYSRNAHAVPSTASPAAQSSRAGSSSGHLTSTAANPGGSNPQLPSPSALPPLVPAAESVRTDERADENDVTTRNFRSSHSNITPPQPAPTLTLIIRAAEDSWISVTADGQQVTQETLIAPAHTSVRASREIVVKAGNAAGVSFVLNGKDFSPQSNESEVKTFIFDNTGIRTADPAR
jgi:cytoskeleton protein RodZ